MTIWLSVIISLPPKQQKMHLLLIHVSITGVKISGTLCKYVCLSL